MRTLMHWANRLFWFSVRLVLLAVRMVAWTAVVVVFPLLSALWRGILRLAAGVAPVASMPRPTFSDGWRRRAIVFIRGSWLDLVAIVLMWVGVIYEWVALPTRVFVGVVLLSAFAAVLHELYEFWRRRSDGRRLIGERTRGHDVVPDSRVLSQAHAPPPADGSQQVLARLRNAFMNGGNTVTVADPDSALGLRQRNGEPRVPVWVESLRRDRYSVVWVESSPGKPRGWVVSPPKSGPSEERDDG